MFPISQKKHMKDLERDEKEEEEEWKISLCDLIHGTVIVSTIVSIIGFGLIELLSR